MVHPQGKVQFLGGKYFPLSDRTKIKVIDKLEVADSEFVYSLHEKALVSEICAFHLTKSDKQFIISSNSSAKKLFIWRYMLILFEEIAISPKLKLFLCNPKLDLESATSIT